MGSEGDWALETKRTEFVKRYPQTIKNFTKGSEKSRRDDARYSIPRRSHPLLMRDCWSVPVTTQSVSVSRTPHDPTNGSAHYYQPRLPITCRIGRPQEQRENQMCTMHTASTERAHSPNSVSFATSPTTAAVDHSNMMPGSCIENNVRAHCPYKMQLAEIFGHFIGPRAGTTVIGRYKYGARPKTPSGRSCGLHGRRPWNSSRKLDSMTGGRWAVTAGGEDDEKKERQREQRKLTSTDRPSKIAWTGPCGVRGVVTRMKGYEKVIKIAYRLRRIVMLGFKIVVPFQVNPLYVDNETL